MSSIYSALTASSLSDSQGLKTVKVFYDTLTVNLKTEKKDILLIEKLNFDYDANAVSLENNGYVIVFGDSGSYLPNKSTGNQYVDTVLLEKEKRLLICGLSAMNTNVSHPVLSGNAYIPIVYDYTIDTHKLQKIYPAVSADIVAWNSLPLGIINEDQIPLLCYNFDNKQLNMLVSCVHDNNNLLVDITLQHSTGLLLNNVQLLSSSARSDYSDYKLVRMTTWDDERLLLANATISGDSYIVPIKFI